MSGPRAPTLIAVHLPKTAGTSFRDALQAAYGNGLRLDYGDRPMTQTRRARRLAAASAALRQLGRQPEAEAIYGHFLPAKYAWARNVRFAIWLRDPVQRVLSRYRHYLRDCAADDRSHWQRGLTPGLSLAQFAALAHYRNTCSEYLWRFPLQRFSFIGLVENYEEDLQRFAATFGIERPLPVTHANVHPAPPQSFSASAADLALIRSGNAADIALYELAQRLNAAR